MAYASSQDKEVPDSVVIFQPLQTIKNSSQRVGKSAGSQKNQAGGIDIANQRFNGHQDQPAHSYVQQGGKNNIFFYPKNFINNPHEGYAPDHSEYGPSQGTLEADQGQGCIGPGNEKVYAGMVQDAENILDLPSGKYVVEGGGQVQKDQSNTVNAEGRHMLPSAVIDGKYHQDHQGSNGQAQAHPVQDSVGHFFISGKLAEFYHKDPLSYVFAYPLFYPILFETFVLTYYLFITIII